MKTESADSKAKQRPDPIGVRFTEEEGDMLKEMKRRTGLPLANIIRRAVRFAVPKFQSGEVNPLEIPDVEVAAK